MPDRLTVYRPSHPAAESAARDHRPSAARRGYGRPWRRRRDQVLGERPLCEGDCKAAGRVTPATDVDHVVSRAAGGDDSDANLRPLCKPCHSRKTVRTDGGLGHARGG